MEGDVEGPDLAKRCYYEALFYCLGPYNGKLPGEKLVDFFKASGLPQNVLTQMWGLSDADQDGCLDLGEFCLSLHLTQGCLRGQHLPEQLPEHLQPMGGARLELAPMTREENDAYTEVIRHLAGDNPRKMEGRQLVQLLLATGLDPEHLARIWDTVDLDRDGYLVRDEFMLLLHMMRLASKGEYFMGSVDPLSLQYDYVCPNTSDGKQHRLDQKARERQYLRSRVEARQTQAAAVTRRLAAERRLLLILQARHRAAALTSTIGGMTSSGKTSSHDVAEALGYQTDKIAQLELVLFSLRQEGERLQGRMTSLTQIENKLSQELRWLRRHEEAIQQGMGVSSSRPRDPFSEASRYGRRDAPALEIPAGMEPFIPRQLGNPPVDGAKLFLDEEAPPAPSLEVVQMLAIADGAMIQLAQQAATSGPGHAGFQKDEDIFVIPADDESEGAALGWLEEDTMAREALNTVREAKAAPAARIVFRNEADAQHAAASKNSSGGRQVRRRGSRELLDAKPVVDTPQRVIYTKPHIEGTPSLQALHAATAEPSQPVAPPRSNRSPPTNNPVSSRSPPRNATQPNPAPPRQEIKPAEFVSDQEKGPNLKALIDGTARSNSSTTQQFVTVTTTEQTVGSEIPTSPPEIPTPPPVSPEAPLSPQSATSPVAPKRSRSKKKGKETDTEPPAATYNEPSVVHIADVLNTNNSKRSISVEEVKLEPQKDLEKYREQIDQGIIQPREDIKVETSVHETITNGDLSPPASATSPDPPTRKSNQPTSPPIRSQQVVVEEVKVSPDVNDNSRRTRVETASGVGQEEVDGSASVILAKVDKKEDKPEIKTEVIETTQPGETIVLEAVSLNKYTAKGHASSEINSEVPRAEAKVQTKVVETVITETTTTDAAPVNTDVKTSLPEPRTFDPREELVRTPSGQFLEQERKKSITSPIQYATSIAPKGWGSTRGTPPPQQKTGIKEEVEVSFREESAVEETELKSSVIGVSVTPEVKKSGSRPPPVSLESTMTPPPEDLPPLPTSPPPMLPASPPPDVPVASGSREVELKRAMFFGYEKDVEVVEKKPVPQVTRVQPPRVDPRQFLARPDLPDTRTNGSALPHSPDSSPDSSDNEGQSGSFVATFDPSASGVGSEEPAFAQADTDEADSSGIVLLNYSRSESEDKTATPNPHVDASFLKSTPDVIRVSHKETGLRQTSGSSKLNVVDDDPRSPESKEPFLKFTSKGLVSIEGDLAKTAVKHETRVKRKNLAAAKGWAHLAEGSAPPPASQLPVVASPATTSQPKVEIVTNWKERGEVDSGSILEQQATTKQHWETTFSEKQQRSSSSSYRPPITSAPPSGAKMDVSAEWSVPEEVESSEAVDRDSIQEIHSLRSRFEQLTPSKGGGQAKSASKTVRHWEVKAPSPVVLGGPGQLSKVKATAAAPRDVTPDVIETTEVTYTQKQTVIKQESDDEEPEATEESIIDREIRSTLKREASLRKHRKPESNSSRFSEPEAEGGGRQFTYTEMTEADRGAEMAQRESIIEREIREQQEKEAGVMAQRMAKMQAAQHLQQESPAVSTPESASDIIVPSPARSQSPVVTSSAAVATNRIAQEMAELQAREEELRRQRGLSGALSPALSPAAGSSGYSDSRRRDSRDSLGSLGGSSSRDSRDALDSPGPLTRTGPTVAPLVDREGNDERRIQPQHETPIEREIRLARERELQVRQERGMPGYTDHSPQVVVEMAGGRRGAPSEDIKDETERKWASSRLQRELEQERRREEALRQEGTIKTTSDQRIGEPMKPAVIEKTANSQASPASKPNYPTKYVPPKKAPTAQPKPVASPASPVAAAPPKRGVVFDSSHTRGSGGSIPSRIQREIEENMAREQDYRHQRAMLVGEKSSGGDEQASFKGSQIAKQWEKMASP